MNKSKWILTAAILSMIVATAGMLTYLRNFQKLGQPGVKTTTIPGSSCLRVELPEYVLNYQSKALPESKLVLDALPKDTSFGQRVYQAPDGFAVLANVVLMGADRTSLHKPQICLRGQGLNIETTQRHSIHLAGPAEYDFPVMKLTATPSNPSDPRRAVYVYWFVADNAFTCEHNQRMWWMITNLLTTGVLQRWAYVSYLAYCAPGQEDATFARMKTLIAASAPQFQIPPRMVQPKLAAQN
jgi:hypothetical protein